MRYWNQRSKDARNWCFFSTFVNMVFQTTDLILPWSDRHFYVNIGYQTASFISLYLLFRSFKDKKRSINLIYVTSLYCSFRQTFKIFDLEQVREGFDEADWCYIVYL
jgi:hypothetical protein